MSFSETGIDMTALGRHFSYNHLLSRPLRTELCTCNSSVIEAHDPLGNFGMPISARHALPRRKLN